MKAIPEISVEAKILLGLFQKMEVGDILHYTALSQAIGRNVQADGYGAAHTARRRAEVQFGIVIAPVMGIGLKRIDDGAIVAAGDGHIRKAKKNGRRAALLTGRVRNFEKLSAEQRADVARIQSTAGVIEMFTNASAQRKLGEMVQNQGAAVPPQKMLDAFRSK